MTEAVLIPPAGSAIALAWLIPVVPAISAGLLMIFGKRLGKLAGWVAITAVGFSATASTLVFLQLRAQPAEQRVFETFVATWLNAGDLRVDWAVRIDPLASVMLLLVTWVGLLIHVYSLGYMAHDERFSQFFAYLNLFAASMLVLVTGSSFLVLFVGWELVGLCSYLLIGFWFTKRDYASAAKKAFVVNRVGDVGFMIAMFLIFATFGSLDFAEVLPGAAGVATGTLVAIGLLLLIGATGKSAQIPLYVWLPDAMAGPTPVSALIHAATMVTAGVYLIARTSPIYVQIPDVGLLIAWVGAATALVAALTACAHCDLKKILAYSTISQLGYMFIGVGLGDYTAATFHLVTHGFFKALLFLCAGAVMHALADQTDVRRMGGLLRSMPITGTTALIGTAAIAGVPFLSGFYSKEEILTAAATTEGAQAIWLLAVFTAGLTAFYMTRWFVLIFLGAPRWPAGAHPHEAPLSMTFPLVVLAVGSLFGGLANLNPETGFLHGWLEPSIVEFEATGEFLGEVALLGAAILAAAVGIVAGFLSYRRVDIATVGVGGGLRKAARNRFSVDEFYERVVADPGRLLAVGFAWFDAHVIDGAVNGLARLTGGLASAGRRVQTGFVRSYALAVLSGAVLIAVLFGLFGMLGEVAR
ncbi:MAG: NADH-quinone oxidoreductase subunit L [Egibacteraceae bacterium]